jgi:hypothetical protein
MRATPRAIHFWNALIHTVARNTNIASCILSEPGNLMLDKKSSWKSIPAVCWATVQGERKRRMSHVHFERENHEFIASGYILTTR